VASISYQVDSKKEMRGQQSGLSEARENCGEHLVLIRFKRRDGEGRILERFEII
jgi:hypothetical protein